MYPSLELNWLSRREKWLILPKVIYVPSFRYFGCYYHPYDGEIEIEDRAYDCSKGIIMINPIDPEEIAATIAHEWRHHWQYFKGWEYDGLSPEVSRMEYYLNSRSEFDAMRFELKVTEDKRNREFFRLPGKRKPTYFV